MFAKILYAEGQQRSPPISLNVLARIFVRLANADTHRRASSIRFFSDTAAIDKFHHTFSGLLSLRKLTILLSTSGAIAIQILLPALIGLPLSGPVDMLV